MTLAERTLAATGKAQLTADAVRTFDEAGFVRLRQPTLGGGLSGGYGAYELARVRIPKGSIGVLTLLWQWAASPVGSLRGPVIDLPGVSVTWSLVHEDQDVNGALRSDPDVMNPKVPDGRVPPYGAWSDLRHPWGSHERIKVLVPERSTLSLWVRVWAPGAEIRQVGGRLLGYTQSGESAHAVGNLVMGF